MSESDRSPWPSDDIPDDLPSNLEMLQGYVRALKRRLQQHEQVMHSIRLAAGLEPGDGVSLVARVRELHEIAHRELDT